MHCIRQVGSYPKALFVVCILLWFVVFCKFPHVDTVWVPFVSSHFFCVKVKTTGGGGDICSMPTLYPLLVFTVLFFIIHMYTSWFYRSFLTLSYLVRLNQVAHSHDGNIVSVQHVVSTANSVSIFPCGDKTWKSSKQSHIDCGMLIVLNKLYEYYFVSSHMSTLCGCLL